MAKFIYLYRGPATPMSDFTPEQSAERMAAFGAWMEKVGVALVDVGSPFGPSMSVRDDGTEGTAGDLIGYTIVEADDRWRCPVRATSAAAGVCCTQGRPAPARQE